MNGAEILVQQAADQQILMLTPLMGIILTLVVIRHSFLFYNF